MTFELLPTTEAGQRMVLLAEQHAAEFAGGAEKHDREGSFPFENFQALDKSGFMAAALPLEFGGMGVESIYDIMVAISRLARGDASTAIAANMHITGASAIVRHMRRCEANGDRKTALLIRELLQQVSKNKLVMCFPTTEAGTDLNSPMMEAVPTEGGYILNGRKIFGTLSPAAHLFFPIVRVPNGTEQYVTATALVSRNISGVEVKDNWDSLGMRASGSNDVVFTNCFIPEDRLFAKRESYGKIGKGNTDFALIGYLPLIAAFIGIAEAARETAVTVAQTQRKGRHLKRLCDRIPIQHFVAEIEIELSACRAITERIGQAAAAFLQRYATEDAPSDEANLLNKEVQCMKYVVNRKAIDIVDKAMIVCGGAAYMSKHPLARLYRDVRAGPFMQPFAPYEAFEYIGKIALGLDPQIDR